MSAGQVDQPLILGWVFPTGWGRGLVAKLISIILILNVVFGFFVRIFGTLYIILVFSSILFDFSSIWEGFWKGFGRILGEPFKDFLDFS